MATFYFSSHSNYNVEFEARDWKDAVTKAKRLFKVPAGMRATCKEEYLHEFQSTRGSLYWFKITTPVGVFLPY